MTETTGQAFRRVRKQRRDKMIGLCTTINASTSHVNYIERDLRQVPKRWLKLLPPEYAAAIVPIWIAELEELLPKDERPRQGDQAGPLLRSRNTGRISQAQSLPIDVDQVKPIKKTAPDPSPCSLGTPWGCGIYGESPEERAFRRFPVALKL